MRLKKRQAGPDADGFYNTTIAPNAVPLDRLLPVRVDGQWLVLVRLNGSVFAFSRHCPHAAADLSQGDLHRGRVSCPDHGYKFDIATGRLLWPEDEVYRLRHYSVKEIDSKIYVKLNQ